MEADWAARGLAIASLATGIVGAVVAWLALRRDRPHLHLTFDYGRSAQSLSALALLVVNAGRRPVTVLQVQLVTIPLKTLERRLRVLRLGPIGRSWFARTLPPPDEEGSQLVAGRSELEDRRLPVLLQPGETAKFDFRRPVMEGARLYASVTDVLGRETVRPLSPAELRFGQTSPPQRRNAEQNDADANP